MDELSRVLLRSIFRSRNRYAGYLLACVVAVSTFFSFGFFVTHPDTQALVAKDYASVVIQLLVLGQLGVAVFAIFFVAFFHRFLIRLRGKEFGLLTTLGMSARQLQRLVRLESVLLGGSALVIGFILSLGETFVLFRVLGFTLGVPPLTTNFNPLAIGYGSAFFVSLFTIDAWLVGRLVRAASPKQFLVASRTSQRVLAVSRAKIIIGLGALALGYTMALAFKEAPPGIQAAMILPTTVLVVLGTYVMFSELLIGVLGAVRLRTRSGYALISSSRLAHRVRDFARILTVVSVLSAGVMVLMGVAFGVLSHLKQMARSPEELHQMVGVFAILLFVFFFLAALFLLAAMSTLYVKLFTQLAEDRGQFAGLRRIGVSPLGVRTILSRELALLFFAPAVVASAHAAVAMGEFTTKIAPQQLSQVGAWAAFAAIVVTFMLLFAAYFVVSRRQYERALFAGASAVRF